MGMEGRASLRCPVTRRFDAEVAGGALSSCCFPSIHYTKQMICQCHDFERLVRIVNVYVAMGQGVFIRADRARKKV